MWIRNDWIYFYWLRSLPVHSLWLPAANEFSLRWAIHPLQNESNEIDQFWGIILKTEMMETLMTHRNQDGGGLTHQHQPSSTLLPLRSISWPNCRCVCFLLFGQQLLKRSCLPSVRPQCYRYRGVLIFSPTYLKMNTRRWRSIQICSHSTTINYLQVKKMCQLRKIIIDRKIYRYIWKYTKIRYSFSPFVCFLLSAKHLKQIKSCLYSKNKNE